MNEFVEFIFHGLLSISLSTPRLLIILVFVPLFNFKQVNQKMVKVTIVIALTLPFSVSTFSYLGHSPISAETIILIVIKESIIGLMIGFFVGVPFWIFQSVGAMIDNQRGALAGGYLNPASGPDASMLGDLLNKFLVIVFITTGVFNAFVFMVYESFEIWPIISGLPRFSDEGYKVIINQFNYLAVQFVLYSGPIVLVLLLVECAFAILGAYSPQLQVYFIAMPAKSITGLAILILYLTYLFSWGVKEGNIFVDLIDFMKMISKEGAHE